MKKSVASKKFLSELEKVPIVTVACKAVGISRQTAYRWKKEDPMFSAQMDAALEEGIGHINDMSESQLISLVQERKWPALQFWLKNHHPKYRTWYRKSDTEERDEGAISQEEAVAIKAMQERFTRVAAERDQQRLDYIDAVKRAERLAKPIIIKKRKTSKSRKVQK